MRFFKPLSRMLLALIGVAGCHTPVAPGGTTMTDTLVASRRQEGAKVERMETLPRSAYPFFSTQAVRLQVNGLDVQVFRIHVGGGIGSQCRRNCGDGNPNRRYADHVGGYASLLSERPPHRALCRRASQLTQLLEKVLGPAIINGQA